MKISDREALDYHSAPRPGKIAISLTKPCLTQRDLSLAYTPGVAVPCLKIQEDAESSYLYTGRGNLVAVISNGTAVLGLGNIGPVAAKPVMEGKGVLFKRFADIDVFDLEIDAADPDAFVECVKRLEPTFGGINLEDVKAPECFQIEERLKKVMSIPVFHDDQHGTAIISGAALLNAVELAGKRMDGVTCVICGAGAAGIACARMFVRLGMKREQITLVDRAGVVYRGRARNMNPYKEEFAADTAARSLADALRGADVFVGLSDKGLVSADMLRSMQRSPIVFAMANPDPEISYPEAAGARSDVIMATGRSDYPNQVNNVLGFPFIFRGALDVRASAINEDMKVAAVHALAQLAKEEEVPDSVLAAYGLERLRFGPEYIIPKPFDPRVLLRVAPAVARAAMESGVARRPIPDFEQYTESLERIQGRSREVMRVALRQARRDRCKIIFPEAEEEKVLKACQQLRDEEIAQPVLVGDALRVRNAIERLGLDLQDITIIDPLHAEDRQECARELLGARHRRGMTPRQADLWTRRPLAYGLMQVRRGAADGLVCGVNQSYSDTIRPALQIVGLRPGISRVAGLYAVLMPQRIIFLADATVNIEPDAETLAEIAVLSAETVATLFSVEPRVAMLSFSSFGSVRHPLTEKVQRAAALARERLPGLQVDGEMQADVALVPELCKAVYPHSLVQGDANVLVFPDLQSGNIAYKLMHRLAGAEVIGPIVMGMRRPVNVIDHFSSAEEIVRIAALTAAAAGRLKASEEISERSLLRAQA